MMTDIPCTECPEDSQAANTYQELTEFAGKRVGGYGSMPRRVRWRAFIRISRT